MVVVFSEKSLRTPKKFQAKQITCFHVYMFSDFTLGNLYLSILFRRNKMDLSLPHSPLGVASYFAAITFRRRYSLALPKTCRTGNFHPGDLSFVNGHNRVKRHNVVYFTCSNNRYFIFRDPAT